eukprot:TRINITY_DN18277_c0_g1_i1.p1 TRINITY_DN18277_c0_g1~~TRINITY_DN18277_c0_g1_i1.p1  ORF type:complete len:393 (+),score=78.85 TRINITY_DN18277_c0_g1_i1:50-1228(+)
MGNSESNITTWLNKRSFQPKEKEYSSKTPELQRKKLCNLKENSLQEQTKNQLDNNIINKNPNQEEEEKFALQNISPLPSSSRSRPILIPFKDSSSTSDSCGIDTFSTSDLSGDEDERQKISSKDDRKTLESKLLTNVYITRFHNRYLEERILAPKLYYEKTKSFTQYSLEHSISMFAIIYLPNWHTVYQDLFLFPPSKSEDIFFHNFTREHRKIDSNDLDILSQFFVKRAKHLKLFKKIKSPDDPLGVNDEISSFRRFSEIIYSNREKSVECSGNVCKSGMSSLRCELEEGGKPTMNKFSLKMMLIHYFIVHYRNYPELWDEKFTMLTQALQKSVMSFLKEYPTIDNRFLAIFDVRSDMIDKVGKRKEIVQRSCTRGSCQVGPTGILSLYDD